MQSVCTPKCAYARVQEQNRKEFNKETRRLKKEIQPLRVWIKEAQTEFNKFIRLRDIEEPCISCGRHDHEIEDIFTGGKWDCGHFLSRGAFPELRFEELNAHKQCKSCNGGSGQFTQKNHTVTQDYEIRLIKKIGQEKVDWLKGPHKPKNYTIEDVKEIKAYYKEQNKQEKG